MSDMIEKKKFWTMIGAYYQKNLSMDIVSLYAEHSQTVTLKEIQDAFMEYCSSEKANFFPIPAVLIRIARPKVQEQDESQEVPGKIFESIRKFGYMGGVEARKYMGEIAWSVCEAFGGYSHICESENLGNEGTIRAQMRDTARSVMARNKEESSRVALSIEPGKGVRDSIQTGQDSQETAPLVDPKVQSLLTDLSDKKSLS